jgi:hypothetical protein
MFKVNKVDYTHPEFKFTKRDEPVEENKTITVSHALNMLCKHDRDIIDSFNNNDSVDDEHSVNLLAGIFGKCSHVNPSTLLKRELLVILEKAGKKPKKDTIAIIEHAIDKAFKNE